MIWIVFLPVSSSVWGSVWRQRGIYPWFHALGTWTASLSISHLPFIHISPFLTLGRQSSTQVGLVFLVNIYPCLNMKRATITQSACMRTWTWTISGRIMLASKFYYVLGIEQRSHMYIFLQWSEDWRLGDSRLSWQPIAKRAFHWSRKFLNIWIWGKMWQETFLLVLVLTETKFLVQSCVFPC